MKVYIVCLVRNGTGKEPQMWGGGCGVSANEYSCAHGAQTNFGDLTPYLPTLGTFFSFPPKYEQKNFENNGFDP